ncbi:MULTISPECIES: aspartate carbamoyltransferase catalytic subunit [Cyanophyceae]|uniref:aspartate carbamoyltransferase catalytic subunit n=1 Tax=Cyanophyceae TaxID=3028117 RepID=UPI0002EB917C|nr:MULTISPECIES: aspartate carbamoyltransferase catalytic subunit [Cyanophyceae]AMA08651.1 aspartate carbamoyltransferase [Picosynechococcus sp. PCC 73109]ANV86794.1 aspartate carbamoyltransferase [Picosynechococcus sp. PCC 7117]ANV89952.1 aspartate carbamoyltransferase [Picosynechococcus sp. PCC 8807]SMH37319.1 aspartate carbamoyltransferase [Picosynechococcus sp. OG1]SMQ77853.1 aspartate carbamoyltransferase [Synechococcus sp. 7002]
MTTATATWTRRHILSLMDFSVAELDAVLQTTTSLRDVLFRRMKKVPALQGQVVTNMFFEPSTRTRSSFELAAKRLSADVMNFAPGSSSLSKGETILDTAKTYLAMGADIMVIRHQQSGVPQAIAAEMDRINSGVSILNAGDGLHAHPSQALLDLFTICRVLDPENPRCELLRGKKIAIVGDIMHSRVARSNIWSLTTAGADVHLAAPPTLLPEGFREFATDAAGSLKLHWDIEPALKDADFVMTLRLQHERMTAHLLPSLREYHQRFGITGDRLKFCQPDVKVLHPGPVNRGVELASDVMDHPALSLVSEQVTNGVAVRMALLYLIGSSKANGSLN